MRTISLGEIKTQAAVSLAAKVVRHQGVVLFPTDTLYGLGADAFSDAAVDKIYDIKGRDERKPIHCIVADMAMAELYAHVDNDARLLWTRLMPGGLTLILRKRPHVTGGIARGMETIGLRMPNDPFCLGLTEELDRPYTATSANVSGLHPESSIEKILHQLGPTAASIDLAIDKGELPFSLPSTVVDLSGEEPVILREGAVSFDQVWGALGAEL